MDNNKPAIADAGQWGERAASLFPFKDKLPDVVAAMLAELERRGTVQHVCQYPLPSEEGIIHVLNLVCEIMFPGYFGKKGLDRPNLSFHLGETVNQAHELLAEEITRCLLHGGRGGWPCDRLECEEEGQKQSFALMEKLPGLLAILDGDVRAAYMGDPAASGYDEIIFCYPGFRAILIYRIAHELRLQGVRWLPRIMTEYAHRITGVDINPGAKIGKNFFIDHATGVVIGETTEVGDNVRLYQGVTLGAWSFQTDEKGELVRGYKRHPTIEDDVIVYSNASILGPVTIGKGSIIGANVLLTHSVDAGTQVSIEKPKHRIQQRNKPASEA